MLWNNYAYIKAEGMHYGFELRGIRIHTDRDIITLNVWDKDLGEPRGGEFYYGRGNILPITPKPKKRPDIIYNTAYSLLWRINRFYGMEEFMFLWQHYLEEELHPNVFSIWH